MKPRAALHQSPKRQRARDIERRDDLAAGADADLMPQIEADQRVVHQQQRFTQRWRRRDR